MEDPQEREAAVIQDKNTCAYVALIFAVLLNLILVILLVYFVTDPVEVKQQTIAEPCSPTFSPTNTTLRGNARAAATTNPIQPTALAWGQYQVSHSYVMTVPYENRNVLIYQQAPGARPTSTDDRVRYFYQPALTMRADAPSIALNPFSNNYEIHIPVLLWDREYEAHIRQKIMEQTGSSDFLLTVLPLEEIRISSVSTKPQIQLVTRWIPVANQPSVITFLIICRDNETCVTSLSHIKENPQQFAADVRVHYSLESQSSSAKRITVTTEHVEKSSLYAAINQKLPNKDPIYLTADDVNTLQREIMTNIQATEIEDADFVSDASQPSILGLINEALKLATRSSKDFEEHNWDSVFWNDDNARPDKVTKKLNEVARKLDKESREKLKKEQAKAENSGWKFDASVTYKKIKVGAGASEEQEKEQLSEKEVEELKKALEESRGKSVVEGEIYKARPMELKRINTGSIKSGAALSTSLVRLAKATAQISDTIKIHDARNQNITPAITFSGTDLEVFHVRGREDYILYQRHEAREICQQYNAKLATTLQVQAAWVAGAQWCSAGHVEDDRLAYPGHVCYVNRQVHVDGRPVVPWQQESAACHPDGALQKAFMYTTNERNSTRHAYKDTWRLGVNCWGVKPAQANEREYKGRMLQVWSFNATHYSQFGA